MIAITNQAALHADVFAHAQRLGHRRATETRLTRTARINLHQQPTSLFRFVGQHIHEGRPAGIVHGLGKYSTRHTFDVQILDSNQPVCINDFARFFMMKVPALIANVVVESRRRPLYEELLRRRYGMAHRSRRMAGRDRGAMTLLRFVLQ